MSQPGTPQLSSTLEATLATLEKVHTRRPWLDFARVATLALVPAAAFNAFVVSGGLSPVQPRHLTHGPFGYTLGMALLWLAIYLFALAAAVVPGRADVMPNDKLAVIAAVAAVALVLVASLLSMDHPAGVYPPGIRQPRTPHCLIGALICATTPLLLGLRAQAGVRPLRAWPIGAALGAASGALGGLHLHLACPVVDGTSHYVLGHAMPAIIAATFGALASELLARRGA